MDKERKWALRRKLDENLAILEKELGVGESFDVIVRKFTIGGRKAALVFLDGFAKDLVMQGVTEFLLKTQRSQVVPHVIRDLIEKRLTFIEAGTVNDINELIDEVLAGPLALLVDGEKEAILIDAREYPGRNPDEPDLERVLRGSRDGFVETLIFNVSLVRRRIRDRFLRTEVLSIGSRSKTDVCFMYIKDIANPTLVQEIRDRLANIVVDAIPMAEKTVEEFIVDKYDWWNPFPIVRYTERPDVVAVHLLEGHVAIMVDTSPGCLILPATLFHHVQHAEEFRDNVAIGAYMRWVRFLGLLFAWFGTPLWLLLATNRALVPPFLAFIGPQQPTALPLGMQFIIAEVAVDLIRIALIHTPNALATSLGFIGALLLGEMAIEIGLFAAETVIYVAVAAIGTFASPSMEFGQAIRLFRLLFIILVFAFGPAGLAVGLIFNAALLLLTKSFSVPYLWPLLPFDWRGMKAILVRQPVPVQHVRLGILRPQKRRKR